MDLGRNRQHHRIHAIAPLPIKNDFDVDHGGDIKRQMADGLSRLRMAGEAKTHLGDDPPVLVIEKQENVEQTIHEMNTDDNEKVSILATGEQQLDAILTEKELKLEQKLDDHCCAAALHLGQPIPEISIDNWKTLVR